MARDTSFNDYVLEQLAGYRGVTSRGMFGGFGLYRGGVMFGLIASNELYFKVGPSNRPDYEAQKSQPFVYQARGKSVRLPYWRVPDDVLEESDLAVAWAAKAYVAAMQAKKPAKTSSARSPRAGAPSRARVSARRAKA